MPFEIPSSVETQLREIATPWGTLYGLPMDRIAQTILADGQYEWAETAIVGLLLRSGATAIDVGANIGYYTALFARLAGPQGAVHSFEANPFTAAILARTKAANGWANVVVNNRAVGDAASTIRVRAMDLGDELREGLNLGGWSLRPTSDGEWQVEMVTLDRYVREQQLGKLHLLKVDVEGYEPKVLQGASETLRKFHPYVIIEMRAEDDAERRGCEQVLAQLMELDYVCCRIMKRPFPHFRTTGPEDFEGEKFHFNLLALPAARYEEFAASFNRR